MNAELTVLIKDRIDAGVEFADANMPGWREILNTETFDISYPDDCVLGQWWLATNGGDPEEAYERAREHLIPEYEYGFEAQAVWSQEHGFSAMWAPYSVDELNHYWWLKFIELGMVDGNITPEFKYH